MGGVPTLCMDFEPSALKTNEEFVLVDLLRRRINLIPIRQDIDPATIFTVNAANTGESLETIKSSSIRAVKSTKPVFNETFDLVDLRPGKALSIDRITLVRGYGTDDARHVVAFRGVLVATDQMPYDQFTGKGIPSAVSNPRNHKLTFQTNGNTDPVSIVDTALGELLSLVERGRKAIPSVQSRENLSSVSFEGTNDTLGNMLLRTAYDVYPTGADFRYGVDELGGKVTFEIRSSEDPAMMLGAIFSEIRITLERLRKSLASMDRVSNPKH